MKQNYSRSIRTKIHKKEVLLFILISIDFCLASPITISFDSYLYLTSGLSLFSGDFPYWYLIMREPGYPLIIKVFSFFPNTLTGIVLFQAVLIGCGSLILSKAAQEIFKLSNKETYILGLIGITMIRGYSSSILQQALIFTIGTVVVYLNVFEINFTSKKIEALLWGVIGLTSALLSSALFIIVLASKIFEVLINKKIIKSKNLILSVLLGGITALTPWYALTSQIDLSQLAYPSCRNSFCITGHSPNGNLYTKYEESVSAFTALMYLSPEKYYGVGDNPRIGQTAIDFGTPIYATNNSSGLRLLEGPEKHKRKLTNLLYGNNIPKNTIEIQNLFSKLLIPAFPLFGIVGIFWMWKVFLRREEYLVKLLSYPIISVFAYASTGAGISRYNVMFAFLGSFLSYQLLKETLNKIRLGK